MPPRTDTSPQIKPPSLYPAPTLDESASDAPLCPDFLEWSEKAGYLNCTSDVQLALWDAWQAGKATETMRADQLALNGDWLRDKTDRIHMALCPGKRGSWQQRAQQALEAAEHIKPKDASQQLRTSGKLNEIPPS